ncbi:sigma 54-interacting transcriptional regulator [Nitratidesulfovibrio vulgaris]|jgi:Nif-specific regulatory protein|uniref:Nif-specific regulatory protein n=1 Tax=Nitratidesulfovibrio vulgaris (strain ATCC 29579 / DSM 644 / CCUG 34227 / NCIMB 8303 / VKM B-1760 / Hildenborough) TaxID=882 RepID=Q72WE6_NITV2|nr:sigma 54-interacting transcriptional regulator [Nitratidesulfovibrio vulgaris]AAS94455.1 Nif-specific regulatory protein [Nitratidesulfovibrio vulgaris str. Hildenborough]ADP88382.1 transcriptional regulator, NifA subfamily, Fis Family [Nitratidesulfovibrio vulgaris RCH1]
MTCTVHALKLKALRAISNVIDRALQLEDALTETLRVLAETLAMQRGTITLLDGETGQLVIAASHGLSREEQERGVYRLDEGVTGTIFSTGRPYLVRDVRNDPLFLDRTGARRVERGKVSFLGVPILSKGRPVGVLNVDRLFGDAVSCAEDIEFLEVVATLVAQFLSLNEQVAARERALRRENMQLRTRVLDSRGDFIVGRSGAMAEVQRYIQRVAGTRATVLLLGESGVGKTLIARLVHTLSEREHHPFIKVNCASIPESLLEAELFGHEKGAFTGAVSARMGRFEEAHEGTVFLDEIGELPPGIQAKLLRVLQEREFERLGSNRTRRVNVRIVAATNRDLAAQVDAGRFRQDLYYRLCVFPIRVPPLRERPEDITGLLNHFLAKVARDYGRSLVLAPDALELLQRYAWPGNVREMENLIERMAILTDGTLADRRFVESLLEQAPAGDDGQMRAGLAVPPSLREVEQGELLAALRRNGWIQHKAARELGLTPRQMGYRIRQWGLAPLVASERAKG